MRGPESWLAVGCCWCGATSPFRAPATAAPPKPPTLSHPTITTSAQCFVRNCCESTARLCTLFYSVTTPTTQHYYHHHHNNSPLSHSTTGAGGWTGRNWPAHGSSPAARPGTMRPPPLPRSLPPHPRTQSARTMYVGGEEGGGGKNTAIAPPNYQLSFSQFRHTHKHTPSNTHTHTMPPTLD